MNFLTYFVSSVICYCGLLCGIALMKIAPEEKKQLHKAFWFIKISSAALVFIFAAFFYYKSPVELTALIAYAALFLFFEIKPVNSARKLMVNYAVLAVVFYLGASNTNLFLIISSLIFVYGTAAASIAPRKETLYYGLIFLLLSNLLFTTSHF